MAKNKKTHHRPGPGKPRGATYAQVLAHKAAVRKGLEQAARDATVQVQADTHTQRARRTTCSTSITGHRRCTTAWAREAGT